MSSLTLLIGTGAAWGLYTVAFCAAEKLKNQRLAARARARELHRENCELHASLYKADMLTTDTINDLLRQTAVKDTLLRQKWASSSR